MAGYQPMPMQQGMQSSMGWPPQGFSMGQGMPQRPFSHGGVAMPTTGPSGMYDPHGNRIMGPPPQSMGMDPNGKTGGMGGGMPGRQPMPPPQFGFNGPSPMLDGLRQAMAQIAPLRQAQTGAWPQQPSGIGQVAQSLGPTQQQPFSPVRNEGYGQQLPFSPIRREGYR